MIKGIIFDIDGVLLDSMPIWTDLGERYMRSLGIEPEEGLTDILFSMSMEEGAQYMKDRYSLKESTEELLEGISGMLRDFYFNEVKAKGGAATLMEEAKRRGIRMTAATSSPREHVEKALERNGLLAYLDKVFTVAENGKSKHHPDIFDEAAAYMGTSPEETYVIEDSLYALKTAKDAGYRCVGIRDKYGEADQKGLEETADIYLHDAGDLKTFE